MISGVVTLLFAAFRVAKYVRLIPTTTMMVISQKQTPKTKTKKPKISLFKKKQGFTNGIAVIIALGQLHSLQVTSSQDARIPVGEHEWIW